MSFHTISVHYPVLPECSDSLSWLFEFLKKHKCSSSDAYILECTDISLELSQELGKALGIPESSVRTYTEAEIRARYGYFPLIFLHWL